MLTVVPATKKIPLDKLPATPETQGKTNQRQITISFQLQTKCGSNKQKETEKKKSPGSRLKVTWLRLENSLSNSSSSSPTSFSFPDTEDSTGLREKQVETALNLGQRTGWQDAFRRGNSRILLVDWIVGNGSRRQEEIDICTFFSLRSAGDFRVPAKEKKRNGLRLYKKNKKKKWKVREKEKPWRRLKSFEGWDWERTHWTQKG